MQKLRQYILPLRTGADDESLALAQAIDQLKIAIAHLPLSEVNKMKVGIQVDEAIKPIFDYERLITLLSGILSNDSLSSSKKILRIEKMILSGKYLTSPDWTATDSFVFKSLKMGKRALKMCLKHQFDLCRVLLSDANDDDKVRQLREYLLSLTTTCGDTETKVPLSLQIIKLYTQLYKVPRDDRFNAADNLRVMARPLDRHNNLIVWTGQIVTNAALTSAEKITRIQDLILSGKHLFEEKLVPLEKTSNSPTPTDTDSE